MPATAHLASLLITYSDNKDVSGKEEVERYEERLKHRNLRLLPKSASHTWWNGTGSTDPKSDLDHAFTSEGLTFQTFDGGAEIDVRGWPQLGSDGEQTDWINQHSDHGMLYGEVVEG